MKEKLTNHWPIDNNGLVVGVCHRYVHNGRHGGALTLFRLQIFCEDPLTCRSN